MLEAFQDVARDLEAMAGQQEGEFFQAEGRLIFQHVHEHPALYRSILDSAVFTRKLKNVLAEHIHRQAAGHHAHGTLDRVLQDIAVHHMMTAVVGLIEWWLEHDLQPDADEMGQIYERLVVEATWQALNQPG